MAQSAERTPASDECYCTSCGDIIKEETEICPNCGVRQTPAPAEDDNTTAYLVFGLLSGVLSLIALPVVFAPVAIFCGYKLHESENTVAGAVVAALGVLGVLVMLLTFLLSFAAFL
ncbi:hypothetical protein HWV23_04010 [Natronomonas halophila]|uniref:hypothetical protein n=1 Tax=Natronomonas halophila TaxID=2747817 RepID=UPI0015B658E9|nr:hypothetical protein [Natronomonas halophila]QLD84917.1 hypothetical protein HWV23_04010 [Natronomonas halophila]